MGMRNNKDQTEFLFEREIRRVNNGTHSDLIESEVIIDCKVSGALEFDHFRLGVFDYGDYARKEERSLYIRHSTYSSDNFEVKNASKSGYYHGGGSEDEILALCSLCMRRRFKLKGIVRQNENPFRSNWKKVVHPELYNDSENLETAHKAITLAIHLPPNRKLPFMLACRFYSLALTQIEDQTEFAFVSFISAVEVFLESEFKDETEMLFDSQTESLMQKIEEESVRIEIRKRLWKKGAIKRKFVKFILKYISNDFLDINKPNKTINPIVRDDLEKIIGNLYDARSRLLHAGEPLPPTISSTQHWAEMPYFSKLQIGKRTWTQNQFTPNIVFVEKLVHNVLVNYLTRTSQVAKSAKI